jgi:hypothetical protein
LASASGALAKGSRLNEGAAFEDFRMATEPHGEHGNGSVEMPKPTTAPLVLSAGVALMALGLIAGTSFLVIGGIVLVVGLGIWVSQLLPGEGHMHEALAGPEARPAPITPRPGNVEHLAEGMPGYRFRLPVEIHPISAGVKGGLVGGLVMPLPAIIWGLIAHGSLWYPVNLLAGIALPGIGAQSDDQLKQFQFGLFVLAVFVHIVVCLVVGLMYGVLLPTLPHIHKPIAWGGLLMPIAWTALMFTGLSMVNPRVRDRLDWPSFIFAQFIYGIVMPTTVLILHRMKPVLAGIIGGVVGGSAMGIPALLWGATSGAGIWFPMNVLAVACGANIPDDQLGSFHGEWFVPVNLLHFGFSILFGVAFAFTANKLPDIPGPMAWGALVMPLLWTGTNYGLMGVVNPLLQGKVSWPWFSASQFIFGLAASIVVVRSEKVAVQPAGTGR